MREARNEKAFTLCKKRSVAIIKGEISRKIVRSRTQNEERREKSGLHRAKNECDSSKKCRKLSLKQGKVGKTEILERKRRGGVEVKKWALLPILQCYEMAKWVQMIFFSHFFSSKSCRECRNALPLHSQSGKQRSCKRGLRSESDEAAKALL